MSKSTGNFFAMEDVLREFPGEVVRFYLLSTHFRSQSEFSRARLEEAGRGYERLVNACRLLDEAQRGLGEGAGVGSPAATSLVEAAATAREKFLAAMDDDFNSAGAIGQVFELVRAWNTALDRHGPLVRQSRDALEALRGAFEEFDTILGLFPDGFPSGVVEAPPAVLDMVEQRQQARRDRDFARADALRDELAAAGWVVEDTSDGVRVKPR